MQNLQRVDIKVYSDEDCERIYATKGPTDRKYHICAGVPEGGKGQCSVSVYLLSNHLNTKRRGHENRVD